jgi:hypothetical protein
LRGAELDERALLALTHGHEPPGGDANDRAVGV